MNGNIHSTENRQVKNHQIVATEKLLAQKQVPEPFSLLNDILMTLVKDHNLDLKMKYYVKFVS